MTLLSTFDADFFIIEALEAGALGYINKNAQPGEIVEAVRTVSAGKPYFFSTISTRFAIRISKSSFNPFEKNNYNFFTRARKKHGRYDLRWQNKRRNREGALYEPTHSGRLPRPHIAESRCKKQYSARYLCHQKRLVFR